MALSLLDLVPIIYPVTVTDIRQTLEVFKRNAPEGITARDALHAAVMQSNDLTCILSMDQHFDQIEGISRVDVGALKQTQLDVDASTYER